jgi:hypothetical protein
MPSTVAAPSSSPVSLLLAPRRSFAWGDFARGAPHARAEAAAEAAELARALAAHEVVMDRDAVIAELPARERALLEAIWPDAPAEGYRMHASLGAFLVARVAVGMVPAGAGALRHEPLRRGQVVHHLVEAGIDEATVTSVVGDWEACPPGFAPDPRGLDVSRIAGLAERTLTRRERDGALSQVAWSPRCLARFTAALGLLAAIRAVLRVLPPAPLGPDVAVASAALAVGRPERVLELLGARAERALHAALRELAAAQWALGHLEVPPLGDDVGGPVPALEAPSAAAAPGEAPVPAGGDEGDDVLEMVEERIAAPAASAAVSSGPPTWGGRPAPGPERLEAWGARTAAATLAARRGQLLGLVVPPRPATVPEALAPPDADALGLDLDALGAADALAPPVRGALRAIVAAAEGLAPTGEAVASAGGLEWPLRRARALALLTAGDLDAARLLFEGGAEASAPEARWARERALRFGGRQAPRLDASESRPAAAALVADLAHQLLATIAGTTQPAGRGG